MEGLRLRSCVKDASQERVWLVSHGRLGDTMSVEKFHRRRRECLEIGGEGEESFRLTAAEWRFGHGVPASIGPMCIQRQMFLLGVKVPIWPWPVAAGGKGESGGRTRKTKYKYSHCSPSIANGSHTLSVHLVCSGRGSVGESKQAQCSLNSLISPDGSGASARLDRQWRTPVRQGARCGKENGG